MNKWIYAFLLLVLILTILALIVISVEVTGEHIVLNPHPADTFLLVLSKGVNHVCSTIPSPKRRW